MPPKLQRTRYNMTRRFRFTPPQYILYPSLQNVLMPRNIDEERLFLFPVTVLSRSGRWRGASVPSGHPLKRREPCSVVWWGRQNCREPSGGCPGCFGELPAMSSSSHFLPPQDCNYSSLPRYHHPWTAERLCIQEPFQAEKLQNVDKNTDRSNWKPRKPM